MAAVYPTAIATTTDLPDAPATLDATPTHENMHEEARDEIIAIEAELGVTPSGSYSTVAARLDAGWQPIAAASFSSVSTVTITIPSSTYRQVRITLAAEVAVGPVSLFGRVNNDSTAGLHEETTAVMRDDVVVTSTGTGTAWQVGTLADFFRGSTMDLLILETDSSSRCPYQTHFTAYSNTETDCRVGSGGGRLSANRALSSLVLFPASSTMSGFYVAEGYKVP